MRVCRFIAIIAILCPLGAVRFAHASPKADIQAKTKEAMESYDLMDYDAAKKLLTQALSIAKKAKLEKDPATAKAYLDLGIVSFVNQDPDGAKLSFLSAVQIDPKIQIDAAYKSAEMAKLLDQARSEASGGGDTAGGGGKTGGGDTAPAAPGVDCSTVQGLQHTIIDEAHGGAAVPIEALVAADVAATRVSVLYRPEGATEFTEVKLKKEGDCKYTGSIPSSAMKGSLVHYYVAAYGDGPKPVASKGSSGSPNIIEVTAAVAGGGGGGGDNEDPLGGKGGGGGGGGGASGEHDTVEPNVPTGPKRAHVLLAVTGGAGSGYVSGETEGMNTVKNCCFGGPIVVIEPELGYFVKPQLSIGIAGRIGIPLGANVDGHATAAPGAVVRVRYALKASGDGLRFMGQLGAGIIRNTIKLDNAMPGMDTDIVAQGPLLVGGGVGFAKHLTGSMSFVADASLLAGIAVTDHLGSAPHLNNGFGIDFALGLQLGL